MKGIGKILLLAATALGLLAPWTQAAAEPYLAVRTGNQCGACHVNPSGGGLRTAFGDIYSQTQLPQQQVDLGNRGMWLGNVSDWFRVGGNFRYDFTYTDVPHQKRTDGFGIDDFRLYGAADLIQDRLTFYVDEAIAPGAVTNREAYALVWLDRRRYYLKAGQIYLPYGLRLQDDASFVRQLTAINFTTPDNGVELGWQHSAWFGQLAVTNGTAGAPAGADQGKQATASLVYVKPAWRFGGSYSYNDASAGKRELAGLFAGLKTGPIAWLAEGDYVADFSISPHLRAYAGLLEGNWAFMPGNNLKATVEYYKPNIAIEQNQRNRFSVLWEYTPIQFLQTRVGVRRYGGIPQSNPQNQKIVFAELHVFF